MGKGPFHDFTFTWDRVSTHFNLALTVNLFLLIKNELEESDWKPSALADGYLNRSNNKILTDYISYLFTELSPNQAIQQIYEMLEVAYMHKWKQLKLALDAEYDPLNPIDYTDTRDSVRSTGLSAIESKLSNQTGTDKLDRSGLETNGSTADHTETISRDNSKSQQSTANTSATSDASQTQSNTRTGTTDETSSKTSAGNTNEGIFGFNEQVVSPVSTTDTNASESALSGSIGKETSSQLGVSTDSRKEEETKTGIETESETNRHELHDSLSGSVTRSSADSRVTDRSENSSGTREERGNANENETSRRTGRYFQTPQKLLEEEWKVRRHTLLETIYRDIDALICVPIY